MNLIEKTKAFHEVKKIRNAARVKLQRRGFKSTAKLTNYLFNVFLNCDGKILSSHVVKNGLCKEGEFSAWRSALKEQGIIYWHEIGPRKWAYFAGPEIVQYINKEKMMTKELATNEQLAALEKTLTDMIINSIDPVSNNEKRERFANGEYAGRFKIIKT